VPAPQSTRKFLGASPLKWVFALEYVMQGLANPFQGITYQPFFRHFHLTYGMTEAATQSLFAKSYLAWSFKPILGFFIDAYGRTRTLLLGLLSLAVLGFLVAPFVAAPLSESGPWVFFWFMFGLSVVLAATDVSVDRATVIAGDEEARASGQSKATTVGLNQSICWLAIYGTSVVAAVLGGYVAETFSLKALLIALALVPSLVLVFVSKLPRDSAVSVPVTRSVAAFWRGLNTGPILAVMLFYFVFHFQPAMGPLWNNHLMDGLRFTQTQIGFSEGAAYVGYFLGVLLFVWKGVHWQERWGLRAVFRVYILASIVLGLTQYTLVDPWFSSLASWLDAALPFAQLESVRLGLLCTYNLLLAIGVSLIRMATFSVVGAVVPVGAAGSLFAGFMSVANLAYSCAYASGSWLYQHGLEFSVLASVQDSLFGISPHSGANLSVHMLLLIGSLSYATSFLVVHVLPDRQATATEGTADMGPERWEPLDPRLRGWVNAASLGLGLSCFVAAVWVAELDVISSVLICFFGVALLRKASLDRMLARAQPV
jgi:MFS family permease